MVIRILRTLFLAASYLVFFILAACTSKQTDEEILAENSNKPAPYMFHTSQHYYLNWAKKNVVINSDTGKELIAERVKLKVPVKYLQGAYPLYNDIGIRLLPGAKPYLVDDNIQQKLSKKATPEDLKRFKNEWDESFITRKSMGSDSIDFSFLAPLRATLC